MADGPELDIIERGSVRTVRFLTLPDGSAPARDFLEALREDQRTQARGAAILRIAQLLANTHKMPGGQYRPCDEFWEITTTKFRMLTYVYRGEVYLVHGFQKLTDKTPPKELATARRLVAQFLSAKP